MKEILYVLVLLSFSLTALAQADQDIVFQRAGNESLTIYHDRRDITQPSYGLQKIKDLIAQAHKDDPGTSTVLRPEVYSALSLREKFTYHMINGESYSQNCSGPIAYSDDGKKIFARLPDIFGLNDWSSRQRNFFADNRDSVILYMTASVVTSISIGANFKWVIVRLDAGDLIPLLISTYKNQKKKDHDILTVLMLLMRDNNYPPFLASGLYKQFYDSKESSYKRYVDLNVADEALIIGLATGYYGGLHHLVLVPAGQYTIGKTQHVVNPRRKVRVDSFYIAPYETTNRQFATFVAATSYVTDAERRHDALVFRPGLKEFEWIEDSTASWRFPNGISEGDIGQKMDHPVTTISYHDAEAYCKWAGLRLPTLEEWEIACRAGTSTDYFFGKEDDSISRYANVWLGEDHTKADSSDGYMYTSPVGSFAPNSWGLYDMYGNVFEFCSGVIKTGEKESLAHARGGSWWCSAHSCHYFNSCDIGRVFRRASFSNQGFRVAISRRPDKPTN